MQFIVLGYDGTDAEALNRRMAVRDDHLAQARQMFEDKKWLYAAGILDDEGNLVGSMIVCEFDSAEAMRDQWLAREPYILGNVWQEVKVHPAQVAPFLLNR